MFKVSVFFYKKLEYRFLVGITKIENTAFPYKTGLSKTNVKTNRMRFHKERSFAYKYFTFLKILF